MTYNIPHGVYLKLEKIPGLYISKSKVSGRDLFTFKDGREIMFVDNGYNNGTGKAWRFLNDTICTFDFGTDVLPIKVIITDKEYTFQNSKEKKYEFRPEAGNIFLQVLEAYYGKGLPSIIIEDKRKEALQKLIEWKQDLIKKKEDEIFQMRKEISQIQKECNDLNDDVEYITKWGSPKR